MCWAYSMLYVETRQSPETLSISLYLTTVALFILFWSISHSISTDALQLFAVEVSDVIRGLQKYKTIWQFLSLSFSLFSQREEQFTRMNVGLSGCLHGFHCENDTKW